MQQPEISIHPLIGRLLMNCTEYFCRCSGNIENISMTGVRLVQYTGLRQTVSGAETVHPLERQMRKKYWI